MTALHISCLKGLDESTEVLLKFSSAHVNNLDDVSHFKTFISNSFTHSGT